MSCPGMLGGAGRRQLPPAWDQLDPRVAPDGGAVVCRPVSVTCATTEHRSSTASGGWCSDAGRAGSGDCVEAAGFDRLAADEASLGARSVGRPSRPAVSQVPQPGHAGAEDVDQRVGGVARSAARLARWVMARRAVSVRASARSAASSSVRWVLTPGRSANSSQRRLSASPYWPVSAWISASSSLMRGSARGRPGTASQQPSGGILSSRRWQSGRAPRPARPPPGNAPGHRAGRPPDRPPTHRGRSAARSPCTAGIQRGPWTRVPQLMLGLDTEVGV